MVALHAQQDGRVAAVHVRHFTPDQIVDFIPLKWPISKRYDVLLQDNALRFHMRSVLKTGTAQIWQDIKLIHEGLTNFDVEVRNLTRLWRFKADKED